MTLFVAFGIIVISMQILHKKVETALRQWCWEESNLQPFEELILSWNGFRPSVGHWTFWVSLYQKEWSPLLKYAEWGASLQKTFRNETSFIKTDQDIILPKIGTCTGFRVHVFAEEGANLGSLHTTTAALSHTHSPIHNLDSLCKTSLSWIPRKSQILLPHSRAKDLCSPTSTSSAINFLLGQTHIDPVLFAERVRDQEFDIYGNWILNTAEAYHALQGKHKTYVARLRGFDEAHAQIVKGMPVVLSIKGPLEGAPMPYTSGHLILLAGYDPETKQVLCMDPGYATDAHTETYYAIEPFLEAWGRRRNLAYLFKN